MEENLITRKMRIEHAKKVLLLNLPEGYKEKLSPYPSGSIISEKPSGKAETDFVLLFVHNKAELDSLGPAAFTSVRSDGLLWVAYPKISSKLKTDITRDHGWDILNDFKLEGVAMVAIDETWSAMRLKFTGGGKIRQSVKGKAEFAAKLEKHADMDATYITVPFKAEDIFGTKAQVKVKGFIDEVPFRSSLAPYGGVHYLGINKELRASTGKKPGDTVHVKLEADTEDRTVDIPSDLKSALEQNGLLDTFEKTSYTNRKEYVRWIETAKKEETRVARLQKAVERIGRGEKFS